MPSFVPGVQLAGLFYAEVVRPLLAGLPHAAARVGPGSDVLGYDSPRSTDHDWGPRLEVFLAPGADGPALAQRLRHQLPPTFRGWPVNFAPPAARVRSMTPADGPVDHYVTVTEAGRWCHDLLGFDPRAGVGVEQWLATPWQRLAEVTGGAVFHDDTGELTLIRDRLRWYPDDLWRYVLACQWRKIAQEEAFPGRAAESGDEFGSLLVTGRVCREAARLLLLLGRCWPPYEKWVGSAIGSDPVAPLLLAALRAGGFAQREDALCAVLEEAGRRQNALGLAGSVEATRRGYFDRPYRVLGADRFAASLVAAIGDAELRGRPLTGAVSQVVDNTDALTAQPTTKLTAQPTTELG